MRQAFNVINTGKGIFKSWKNVLSGRVERQTMFMKCGEENAKGSREAQPGSYQFYQAFRSSLGSPAPMT